MCNSASAGSAADASFEEAVQLHKDNQLDAAEIKYLEALKYSSKHADAARQLGVLLWERDGAASAEAALQRVRQAIQLNPSCAKYRQSLGRLLAAMGLWEEAAGAYERACEKSPRTVQLHLDLARAYKHLDRHGLAADAYLRVLQLQPNHPSAHCKRAGALRQSRRLEAAAEEYRQQLQLQPQHAQAAFWLAALTGDASTAACPSDMVAGLFDQYADHFDSHLVEKLGYQTPQMLTHLLQATAARLGCSRWSRCVDLGCGTGLMGPLVRPHVGVLAGVDLSAGMVARAQERGCYERLAVGELVAYLEEYVAGGSPPFDLLLAADVFVYIASLQPVLAAAAAASSQGALFAFSTEVLPSKQQELEGGQAVVLQPTGRYAHSRGHVDATAAATGWAVCEMQQSIIRFNAGKPIHGNLCVMRRL